MTHLCILNLWPIYVYFIYDPSMYTLSTTHICILYSWAIYVYFIYGYYPHSGRLMAANSARLTEYKGNPNLFIFSKYLSCDFSLQRMKFLCQKSCRWKTKHMFFAKFHAFPTKPLLEFNFLSVTYVLAIIQFNFPFHYCSFQYKPGWLVSRWCTTGSRYDKCPTIM